MLKVKKIKPCLSYREILLLQICFVFIAPFAISELGISRNILYAMDLINVFLLLYSIPRIKISRCGNIILTMASISFVGLIGWGFFGESILLYVWGLRNTLRYFVFILNCVVLLKKEDVISFLVIVEKILPVNFLVGVFQFFVLKKDGDYLGALFGTLRGANGYLIAYLSMVATYTIALFSKNKISLIKLILNLFQILVLSTLAELKIMFLFVAFISIVTAVVEKPTLNTYLIIIASIILLIVGMKFLSIINPVSFGYFSSIEAIQWYFENSYKGGGGFSRSDGITQVYNMFFQKDNLKQLVGLGLGQCDYSAVGALSSKFYEQYGKLNYRLFFAVMTYLEMGLLGLMTYLGYGITLILQTIKIKDRDYPWIKLMCLLNIAIIAVIAFYNYTLRSEPGYLWAILMVIPYVWKYDE